MTHEHYISSDLKKKKQPYNTTENRMSMKYNCSCGAKFSRRFNYNRHRVLCRDGENSGTDDEVEEPTKKPKMLFDPETGYRKKDVLDDESDDEDMPYSDPWSVIIEDAYRRLDETPENHRGLTEEPFLTEMTELIARIVYKITSISSDLKHDGAYIRVMKRYWKIKDDDTDIENQDAMVDAFMDRRHLIRKLIRQNADVLQKVEEEEEEDEEEGSESEEDDDQDEE